MKHLIIGIIGEATIVGITLLACYLTGWGEGVNGGIVLVAIVISAVFIGVVIESSNKGQGGEGPDPTMWA